jgi:hypothetical protein
MHTAITGVGISAGVRSTSATMFGCRAEMQPGARKFPVPVNAVITALSAEFPITVGCSS